MTKPTDDKRLDDEKWQLGTVPDEQERRNEIGRRLVADIGMLPDLANPYMAKMWERLIDREIARAKLAEYEARGGAESRLTFHNELSMHTELSGEQIKVALAAFDKSFLLPQPAAPDEARVREWYAKWMNEKPIGYGKVEDFDCRMLMDFARTFPPSQDAERAALIALEPEEQNDADRRQEN